MSKKQENKKILKKIGMITFIYIFIFVSILAPFITIEGANKVLGYILVGVLTFIYFFILLIYIWDWIKEE